MKRKLISLVLMLVLIVSISLTASAKTPLIQDFANLLTNEEENRLMEQAADIQDIYELDAVILTVPGMMGKDAQSFADDFFDNNGYSDNGVLFLIDMETKQWHISTSGTAIELLTDLDLMYIEDEIIPYFSEGNYFKGFSNYMDVLPILFEPDDDSVFNFFLCLVIGAAVAAIVILIMRLMMNTKRPQHNAASYEKDGSFHMRTRQDLFLYSNVSKRAKPKKESSGSSTHVSSSGKSHGGRGGSF